MREIIMKVSTHGVIAAFSLLVISGCNDTAQNEPTNEIKSNQAKNVPITNAHAMDLSFFVKDAFTQEPVIVDCKTVQGTSTTCYELKTSGAPAGRKPGAFCPRTTSDGATQAGAWFDKSASGDLVDLTGQFILKLSDYYDDPKWQLYDAKTNEIRYTATLEACSGAARPDVEEQYKQNCIECELSYLEDDFSLTYLIPTSPIAADKPSPVRTVGIALDGTEFSGPAPINAILDSYTIAAFDDCGGHINLHQGYHYHATTGCTEAPAPSDGHAPLIGYAVDGYALYAMRDAQGNEDILDECRGHTDEIRGYHYHAASPSENMFIGCLHGESVRPAGGPPGGPNGPPPGHKPPPR
jgi:hypothetical protein